MPSPCSKAIRVACAMPCPQSTSPRPGCLADGVGDALANIGNRAASSSCFTLVLAEADERLHGDAAPADDRRLRVDGGGVEVPDDDHRSQSLIWIATRWAPLRPRAHASGATYRSKNDDRSQALHIAPMRGEPRGLEHALDLLALDGLVRKQEANRPPIPNRSSKLHAPLSLLFFSLRLFLSPASSYGSLDDTGGSAGLSPVGLPPRSRASRCIRPRSSKHARLAAASRPGTRAKARFRQRSAPLRSPLRRPYW